VKTPSSLASAKAILTALLRRIPVGALAEKKQRQSLYALHSCALQRDAAPTRVPRSDQDLQGCQSAAADARASRALQPRHKKR